MNMKHHLTAMLLAAVFLLFMTGCSRAGGEARRAGPGERMEEKLEAAEDRIKQELRAMTDPVPEAGSTVPENAITKEEAQRIALEYLGLTMDQVKHLKTDYEIDDGVSRYDVEFYCGEWKYEFEIHASTGKILSFDKDHKSD